MKHSEFAAMLAIEGVVAAFAGSVRGRVPIAPKVVGEQQRAELGFSSEGDLLFYPIGESGVFFYHRGANAVVWYVGADCAVGAQALDAAMSRSYPQARLVSDDPHPIQPGLWRKAYDIMLGAGRMVIVEALYPRGVGQSDKFSIRVTTMVVKS